MDVKTTITSFITHDGKTYSLEIDLFESICGIWTNSFTPYFKQLRDEEAEIQELKNKITLVEKQIERHEQSIEMESNRIDTVKATEQIVIKQCEDLEAQIANEQLRFQQIEEKFQDGNFTEENVHELLDEHYKWYCAKYESKLADISTEIETKNSNLKDLDASIEEQKKQILKLTDCAKSITNDTSAHLYDLNDEIEKIKNIYDIDEENIITLMMKIETQIAEMSLTVSNN